jgi:hypothetical protein
LEVALRLDFFLLADHAVAAPDGKLYINGGGITQINVPMLPYGIPYLSAVLRFLVDSTDVGDHTFLLDLESPGGAHLLPQQPSMVSVGPATGHPDEETALQLVLSFGGVPLFEEGTHRIVVAADDDVVRRFNLPVVLAHVEDRTGSGTAGMRFQ